MAAEDPPGASDERTPTGGAPSLRHRLEAAWRTVPALFASDRRKEIAALVLALLPALLLAPGIISKIPLTYDHFTHVFKAWHFWTELLPSGRLRGWSNYWGFGFPSDELVPPGGEVWVGLFHYALLGMLSWARSYAVAFAGLMLLKAYAAFRFARHFFGRTAGVLAAVLMTLDRGGQLEGGWEWHTYWGVWPVTLSMALFALALVRLDRVLGGAGVRDVFLAGLYFALSLLAHALPIVAFPLLVPLLFLDHALRAAPPPARRFASAAAALGLGLGLSGFFLIPFFSHTKDTLDLGWMHESLAVVGQRFFFGQSFQGQWPVVHFLALGGGYLALRRKAPGGFFCASAALVCLFLASNTIFSDLHLERAFPALVKLEVNRLLVVAKLVWFPLAAYAVTSLVALSSRRRETTTKREGAGSVGRVLGAAILLVAAAGLVVPGARKIYEEDLSFPIKGQDDIEHWHDYEALLRWSRQVRNETPGLYRIVYKVWRGNHLPTLLPVYDRTPIYKLGTTPAQIFRRIPMADDLDLYRALSVKYVVTTEPASAPELVFSRRFGSLWVYEFRDFRPDPFTLVGTGHARLLEFSAERIRIALSGTSPGTRLKLHVASYSRWQASEHGSVLPITTVAVKEYEYPILMEVPVTDGEVVFEYVRRPADWLGLFASLASLPVFFGASFAMRRRPDVVERAAQALVRHRRSIGYALIVTLLLLVGSVALRTRTRARLLSEESIFHGLTGPELSLAGERCERSAPLVFHCGPHTLTAAAVQSEVWGIHLCMTAPPVGAVTLATELELGSFLALDYDTPKNGAGRIAVVLDGAPLANFPTQPPWLWEQTVQFDTRARRGKRGELGVTWSGGAVRCFDLRVLGAGASVR